MIEDLNAWIQRVSGSEWTWYVKYVPANDTYAKPNVHQGGPYVGKELLRAAFPALTMRADSDRNPDLTIPVRVASHGMSQDVRLIWYNSRRVERRPNGRDEARLTSWGGREHPLVAEEATGSLVVFAFHQASTEGDADGCELWIARCAEEEDELLAIVGAVDPGRGVLFRPSAASIADETGWPCALTDEEMRAEWRTELPSGEEILEMVIARQPRLTRLAIDDRLMERRRCEYELFRSIENHVVLPRVKEGFVSVEEFITFANSVTNRRKSRSGKSLELQVRQIFGEEQVPHSWTKATEDKRTPDFVFPSIEKYHDGSWPAEKLRMLAAKTTCKDRWRQILNEAARIPIKHLVTLQEGVSSSQFREMTDEGVTLVVPSALHAKFPDDVQPRLLSLEAFVRDARQLGD